MFDPCARQQTQWMESAAFQSQPPGRRAMRNLKRVARNSVSCRGMQTVAAAQCSRLCEERMRQRGSGAA
eukprot:2536383-Rhodomonas_salina.1